MRKVKILTMAEIQRERGDFIRALETPNYIFFVDLYKKEARKYNRQMTLLSEDKNTHKEFLKVFKSKEFNWVNKKVEKYLVVSK